jgi:hypothetical protein
VSVPASTVPLVLTPGGSLEIQVGPQTLALPQPTARLLGADGRTYMWNVFTDDGKIRLAGPVRRIENVVPAATASRSRAGAVRPRSGARSAISAA